MWFGTENGLYRYDGVNLRYFGHNNGDTNSLPSNTVLQIAEGKDGNLWVAMQAGIAEIDPTTLQCKIYNGFNHRLDANNYTNKICVDDVGDIWVGNNLGIFLFNKKKREFLNVWNTKLPGDSLSKYVTSIVSLNNHLIIASTFHDIIFLNKEDKTFKRLHIFNPVPPKDSSITSIFLDSKQKLWIGSWGGGIYTYDITENKLSRLNDLQEIYNTPHFYITSFYETTLGKQQIIWAGTSVGLLKCILNDKGKIVDFAFISHNKNTEHSIIQGIITSFYFDSDGALWCAGEYGICKCFPFQNNFKFFNGIKGLVLDIQSLRMNNTNCYFINSWNSISGTGICVTDTTGKQVYEDVNPHFTDKDDGRNISGVAKDKYNRIWISSMAGISVLDDRLNVIHQWNKSTQSDNNLTYYRTSGIAIHNDTVWVICYHRGIDLFDLSFKKIRHYSCYDNSGLSDNLVSSFFNDSKGNLWICGNSELYKYVPGKLKFKAYGLIHEPGGCGPRDIAETKSGDLMIASTLGVI
ncbi:MAG TPA: two-component regulator propeller domain-containing protein, partial [Bacteroidia bacterium]|nr:two-component regulator propeller domain-containing protein [Bacteroidia bacterium]